MIFFQRLFLGVVFLLTRLPWRILYFISDFVALVLYFVVRYRKKVVFENLTKSFPEKSSAEITRIAHQYYRHMADVMVETICEEKVFPHFQRHMTIKNPEVLERIHATGKSVLLVGGHLGNWEWIGITLQSLTPFKAQGVYKPLSSPFFNNYIVNLRKKYSAGMIPFKQTFRRMVALKNEQFLYMLANDQTPHRDEINYWNDFLNQPTPVFLGTEKIAKSLDMPLVFCNCYRVKRGHYEIELTPITDTPNLTSEFEITKTHVALLEQAIRTRPYNWLWSHRRWKYSDEYPKYLSHLANQAQ